MLKGKAAISLVLINILCARPGSLYALGPDQYKIATATEAEDEEKPSEVFRPKVEFKSDGTRDPFILYVEEKNTVKTLGTEGAVSLPGDFVVQGLIWGGRLNQAIIKNKVVKVGDTLDEVKILEIGRNGVTLFYKGQKFELSSPAAANIKKLNEKEDTPP